jgi:hypothetical protein
MDNRLQNLETRPSPRRIAANAIGASQLQEESVVEGSIAPGIVDGTLIAGGSVGSAQIQDLIITENKIFDGAISTIKIAANAITEAQLAANSVTSAIIAANAVVNSKLAADAVTSINILANSIIGTKIAANAVDSLQIAANAVTATEIAPFSVYVGSIQANAVDANAIAAAAVSNTKIAANAIFGNVIQANAITANKIDVGAVTANAIAANAVTANAIAANAVTANAIAANSVTAFAIVANTITGNQILAGSVTGDRITANSLYGNTIVANTLYGNSIVANTLSGNTIVANTLHGNSVVANTISGNTIIANSIQGNTIIANTLSGNTILANTLSGNTVIANTISGNTIIANSLQGNTIVANTLFGNSIVAGSLTGDRITGTTSIRLADSLNASPTNFIQFGYVTPAGQASPVPGIYGYYGGYPSFYIGGWDRPLGGGYTDAGVSFGIYDYHTSTPVSFLNLYYENVFSAGTQQVLFSTGGFSIYTDGGGLVYGDEVIGDIHLDTNGGQGSIRVSTGQTVGAYGTPGLITDCPIRVSITPVTITATSDNHGIQIGVNGSGIPNQYNVAISDRAIQARLAQSASTLTLNPLGGSVSTGGTIFSGSAVYTMGVTSLTSWQSSATDFGAMTSGAVYSANAGTALLLSRRDATNGSIAIFYRGTTTAAGTISIASATTVTYSSGSDYRLKENVVPLSDGIERLMLLKPRRFNFIEDPELTMDGFMAHEAQEVVPIAVIGEKDGVDKNGDPDYQYIDHSKMVPLLTAALQESIRKIETLETRVTQLGG